MSYSYQSGRPYIHQKCGQTTIITEEHFAGLCNPFEPCSGTICANCGFPDSVSAFLWQDTGESISDYRKRLKQGASSGVKLWVWLISPLLGAAIGATLAVMFIGKNIQTDALVGAGIGVALFGFLLGPKLLTAFAGDRFYSQR